MLGMSTHVAFRRRRMNKYLISFIHCMHPFLQFHKRIIRWIQSPIHIRVNLHVDVFRSCHQNGPSQNPPSFASSVLFSAFNASFSSLSLATALCDSSSSV